MNKAQLTDAVAAATDSSKAEAGRAVEATLSAIGSALAGGDSVSLVGFLELSMLDIVLQEWEETSNGSFYSNSCF